MYEQMSLHFIFPVSESDGFMDLFITLHSVKITTASSEKTQE